MKRIALFTQSLFALGLDDAIPAAAEAEYHAIELACTPPHFGREEIERTEAVAGSIREHGLKVSALSLFNRFTDPAARETHLTDAESFLNLAPIFETRIAKLTPGPPGSQEATDEHWQMFHDALRKLAPIARDNNVWLAVETHMRQLTDTLGSTLRMLETHDETVGVTVDFSNLRFAGDDPAKAVDALAGRIYNTHLKNGWIADDGSWHFGPLSGGMTDYGAVFERLKAMHYDGYLTVECLGPDAAQRPVETARRDRELLERMLIDADYMA